MSQSLGGFGPQAVPQDFTSFAPLFGTGADGNVTISSGTTTLTRDMHYANLTISGTGSINANGFRIFVKNLLDSSSAGTNAIYAGQGTANNASGASGGYRTITGFYTSYFLPSPNQGGNDYGGTGGNGSLTVGSTGNAGNGSSFTMGGVGGTGGNGGASTSGGGAGGVPATPGSTLFLSTPTTTFNASSSNELTSILGNAILAGGGGGGGGDGTNSGGGGGGGGGWGGAIALYARYIQRGSNSAMGIISAKGTIGGTGANGLGGNAAGGGGGGGGPGGFIYIVTEQFLGSVISNGLNVSGGTGGTGGSGLGTGKGGTGGNGGASGNIQILNLSAIGATTGITSGNTMSAQGFNASTFNQPGTAATTATTTAGTAGGAGAVLTGGL